MNALLLAAALSLAHPPVDVDFAADAATLARYDGCRVRVTLTVAAPAWEMLDTTVLGATDAGGFSRAAYVPTCDKDKGDAVTVVGTLRIVRHGAWNGSPAWNEVTVTGRLAENWPNGPKPDRSAYLAASVCQSKSSAPAGRVRGQALGGLRAHTLAAVIQPDLPVVPTHGDANVPAVRRLDLEADAEGLIPNADFEVWLEGPLIEYGNLDVVAP